MQPASTHDSKPPCLFYGVNGEGMGHCARALAIAPRLIAAGWRIIFFAHGRALQTLRDELPDCPAHEIPGMTFVYRRNRVDWLATTWGMLDLAVKGPGAWRLVRDLAASCKPRVVISDYEAVTARSADRLKLPLIALDHQQFATQLELDSSGIARQHMFPLRLSNRMTYPRPALRLVSNFFDAPWTPQTDPAERLLLGPVIRRQVLDASPTAGDHVLVYQTSVSMDWLGQILATVPGEKRVYGADIAAAPGIVPRPFSTTSFLADLASSRYAIINGGYTTLCEALHLGKPLVCLPVRGQAEQELNADYVQRLGMGRCLRPAPGDVPSLADFDADLDDCRTAIARHLKSPGTDAACDAILEKLAGLAD